MKVLFAVSNENISEAIIKRYPKEYREIENFLYTLDLKNGYIQEIGEHEEEYVPKWEE